MIAPIISYSVKFLNVLGFRCDVQCFRSCGLHAKRQFKALNSGSQFTIGKVLFQVRLVELFDQVQLPALTRIIHLFRANQIINGLSVRTQISSLIDTG